MNIWETKYYEEIEVFKKEFVAREREYLSDSLVNLTTEIINLLENRVDTELLGKVLDKIQEVKILGDE
ncbi:MAG: hypothetical protein MR995_05705 [Fusobacterium mortiferum]|uniref:hypothetical protein n=1 Tax=Fusobacterium mortiferum TaxID=850 RepID=UPI001F180AFE|nr:hypothetical protein [Fusobacterium mortiferum]MCF2698196.1 hypothetical protein [Fusobacterium mortiferum]MCI7187618.1 hypothetical protein [Fusobacterium mortiferum]